MKGSKGAERRKEIEWRKKLERKEEWGEVVVAFVVVAAGYVLEIDDLDAHCLENIARFKRPKEYQIISVLPKNNYGKVLKTDLRQSLKNAESYE